MCREPSLSAGQGWNTSKPLSSVHVFSSSTFASALESQSRWVFLRFALSPVVLDCIHERPSSGSDIEACALRLQNLDDLSTLLHNINAPSDAVRASHQLPRVLRESFLLVYNGSASSSSHASSSTSTGVNSSIGAEASLVAWLQLLVWTRCFAVFLMRRLASIHDQISWCVWYWSWAEMHSSRASFHLSFWSRWWWSGFLSFGWTGQALVVRSYAIAHKSALNKILHDVVGTLGAVYSLMDRMNTFLSSMVDTSAGSSLLSPGQEVVTSPTEIQSNDNRLVSNLRRAVVSAVTLLVNTLRPPGTNGFLDNKPRGRTPGAPTVPAGDLPYLGGCADEAVMFDFQYQICNDVALRNIKVTSSIKDIFDLLLDITDFARNYTNTIGWEIQTRHVPPNGRHWKRILIACCVIVPSLVWISANSVARIHRKMLSTRNILARLLDNYVMYPLKEIYRSLTSSRPGVLERRRTLEMEMESMANMIRDYHEDYYPNISQEELRRLRDHTYEHLRSGVVADDEGYRLINNHYERAIRHPIRSTLFGNLLRLMLMQLTYQQLEVMRVVNSTDEVLEGNDLNFKVMAMVPVFLFLSGVLLISFRKRRANLRPVNNQLRLCWRSVHRVVVLPERSLDGAHPPRSVGDSSSFARAVDTDASVPSEFRDTMLLNSHDQGMLLLLTHRMRTLAVEFHANYRYLKEFLEDLDDIESVQSTRYQRLMTLDRMRHVHYFLQ